MMPLRLADVAAPNQSASKSRPGSRNDSWQIVLSLHPDDERPAKTDSRNSAAIMRAFSKLPNLEEILTDFAASLRSAGLGDLWYGRCARRPHQTGHAKYATRPPSDQPDGLLSLECEAWNAIMWAGGPAMRSPGEPRGEPTIGGPFEEALSLRRSV
jgi:hypothetical protein